MNKNITIESAKSTNDNTIKNILFYCAQWGLGHVNREYSIIEELLSTYKDIKLDLILLNTKPDMLNNLIPHERLTINEYTKDFTNFNKIAISATRGKAELDMSSVVFPLFKSTIKKDYKLFKKLLLQKKYDSIVIDEGWTFLLTLLIEMIRHYSGFRKKNLFTITRNRKLKVIWLNDFLDFRNTTHTVKGFFASLLFNLGIIFAFRIRILSKGILFGHIGNPEHYPKQYMRKIISQFYTDVGLVYTIPIELYKPATRLQIKKKLADSYPYKSKHDTLIILSSIGGLPTASVIFKKLLDYYFELNSRIINDYGKRLQLHIVGGPSIDPGKNLLIPDSIKHVIEEGYIILSGHINNLVDHIAISDLLIIKSGLATTTESAVLGIPAILIPVKNHFEQYNVINTFKHNYNFGVPMEMAELNDIELLYKNIKKALDIKDFKKVKNGKKEAGRIIYEITNGRCD